MRTLTKSTIAIGTSALVLTTAGVAYAYWTTTGSGSGSATTGSSSAQDAIALTQVGTLTGFYPGSTPQTVMVKATNPAAYSQKVGEITVTVGAVGSCAASNWAVVDIDDTVGVLAAGANSGALGVAAATIQLVDSSSNQDACKGVSPALTFASAGGE